ncbi:Peroxisomal membrane protein 2 [Senna tora]|uniref:Peroxisomal membrane protein 2 n=1 Tax=Senna tora TaxID=362788 RepID=A0A834WGP8_9FABA|nr:Peroxisomal membrane protein 2 [Senna tora]
MASVQSTIAPQSFLHHSKAKSKSKPHAKSMATPNFLGSRISQNSVFSRNKQKGKWVVSAVEDVDVIPVHSGDVTDQQEGMAAASRVEMEIGEGELATPVSGFGANEGFLSFEGAGEFQGFSSASASIGDESRRQSEEEMERLIDRTINATIVLAAGTFAITKLLTIDRDYWHGWTLFEILRYAPQHNWSAYEEALKTNPVFAKMVISGVVYSVGDWIAQCFEGKPLFEFDRARMFRSGLVGFTLHGSLSHYYYQFCEELFPFQEWWVVPAKVAFDQTAWSAVWNSIYYTAVGFLRLDSPINIFNELKATFIPMLTAGWKLWPFAHLITYGVIPVEQRLLWVDCVELIWVTILSTYSNEKSEARNSEIAAEVKTTVPSVNPPEYLLCLTLSGVNQGDTERSRRRLVQLNEIVKVCLILTWTQIRNAECGKS